MIVLGLPLCFLSCYMTPTNVCFLVELLHGSIVDLFANRVRPRMVAPILVPSFIRVPLLRLSRIDILRLGICLLPTNYQPQPFRVPD